MASRDVPSTADELDPQNVATAFAEQYYLLIHKSPELVYKFYGNQSVLDRLGPDGEMTSVVTLEGINEKIMSSDYKGCSFETTSVDGQRSLMGGILVAVNGYFFGQDNLKKIFYQTFFLAQQKSGYFVLNDILRFSEALESKALPTFNDDSKENASDVLSTCHDQETPDLQIQPKEVIETVEEVPVLESGKTAGSVEKVLDEETGKNLSDDLTNKEALGGESGEKASDIASGKKEVLDVVKDTVAKLSNASINESQNETTLANAASSEKPKFSYASMVAKESKVAPPHNSDYKIVRVSANADHHPIASAILRHPGSTAIRREVTPSNASAETYNAIAEAPGAKSIYIANLPPSITRHGLVDALKTFGRIRPGGVQIRTFQDGFTFGFVEFESASSASKAVEVHNITVEGYEAYITHKKSGSRSGNNSGGGNGGFRNSNPNVQENVDNRENRSYQDGNQGGTKNQPRGPGGQNRETNQQGGRRGRRVAYSSKNKQTGDESLLAGEDHREIRDNGGNSRETDEKSNI